MGTKPASYGPRPGSWGGQTGPWGQPARPETVKQMVIFSARLSTLSIPTVMPRVTALGLALTGRLASSPFSSSTPDLPHYPSCGTALMTAPSPLKPSVAPSGSLSTVRSPHSGTPVHPAQATLVSPALFSSSLLLLLGSDNKHPPGPCSVSDRVSEAAPSAASKTDKFLPSRSFNSSRELRK